MTQNPKIEVSKCQEGAYNGAIPEDQKTSHSSSENHGESEYKVYKRRKSSPELLWSRKSDPFKILTKTSHSSSENHGESEYKIY